MCQLREKCTPKEECILNAKCNHEKVWMPREKYFNIPYSICFYVLKEKMYSQFALFLYLKYISNGKINAKSVPIQALCIALNITERQYRNLLTALKKRNWIGHNKKTDYLFIRGFNKIKSFKGIGNLPIGNNKSGVYFVMKFLPSIKYFCFSAIVASIIKGNFKSAKRKKNSKRYRAELQCDGSNQLYTFYDSQPFYSMRPNMVPTQYLATLLGVSLSTIHLLKKGASRLGYIKIIQNKFLTDILINDFWLFKKTHPYLKGLYKTHSGEVYIKGCDSMDSECILLKRK